MNIGGKVPIYLAGKGSETQMLGMRFPRRFLGRGTSGFSVPEEDVHRWSLYCARVFGGDAGFMTLRCSPSESVRPTM